MKPNAMRKSSTNGIRAEGLCPLEYLGYFISSRRI